MSVPTATRRMFSELNALLDKEVIIKLKTGKMLHGTLHGFDHNLNILLKNAAEDDQVYPIMLVYTESILSLGAAESPLFNPEEFAKIVSQKLNIRETDIKVFSEAGVVVVLNNIRISEKGVEGSGPLAHKIYGLFTEYLESKKKETRK